MWSYWLSYISMNTYKNPIHWFFSSHKHLERIPLTVFHWNQIIIRNPMPNKSRMKLFIHSQISIHCWSLDRNKWFHRKLCTKVHPFSNFVTDVIPYSCRHLSSSMLVNTLRPRQMAAISQTFSNAFSWMKIFEFRFKFHWSLFLRVQLTNSHHWFR